MQIICSVIKGTKVYYNILMQDNSLPNCCAKWEIKLGKLSWKFIFEKVRKIKDIKLRWLQIRILHRILGTNNITNHMGIVINNKCTFCKRDKENIQHIFWNCVYVHIFWNNLWSLVKNKCEHTVNIQVNEELVLFGYNVNSNTDTVFDLILLLAKSYIYTCKMNQEIPILNNFIRVCKRRYEIEKHNAKIIFNYEVFCQQWMLYKDPFN